MAARLRLFRDLAVRVPRLWHVAAPVEQKDVLSEFGANRLIGNIPSLPSHIQIGDAQGIVLNELAAGLDDVPHQASENFVRHIGLFNFDAQH